MKRRKTAGERIAWKHIPIAPQVCIDEMASEIDRAIRRAKAEAWDECNQLMRSSPALGLIATNPYRGRAKR